MHFEETINCFHNMSIFDHNLPHWNSRIKPNLVMGFISQALRINFKSGLIGGAVFATAEAVSIFAEPHFKKLGTHAFYALNQLPKSLIIATVIAINPLGCEKAKIANRHKINIDSSLMMGMQIVFITQDVMLGIKSIGLLAIVEVIKELAFPWFKQKMEESNDLGYAELEKIRKNWELEIEKLKQILIITKKQLLRKIENKPLTLEESETKTLDSEKLDYQALNQQLIEIEKQLIEIEQNRVSIKNLGFKTSYSDEAALSVLSPFIINFKALLLLNQIQSINPFINLFLGIIGPALFLKNCIELSSELEGLKEMMKNEFIKAICKAYIEPLPGYKILTKLEEMENLMQISKVTDLFRSTSDINASILFN